MKLLRTIAFASVLLLYAALALAAPRSFIVAPFQITGPSGYGYLEKAIPSTLATRLYWKDQAEALAKGAPAKAVAGEAAALKALEGTGADFIVWGSATLVGEECNLDVRVTGKDGKNWRKAGKAPVKQLNGAVHGVADSLATEVFGRPAPPRAQGPTVVNQMHPDIVVNESSQQQIYLNPQFRYQGGATGDSSRMRTQTMPFTMVDFQIGNFSGSGKNEIAVISDHRLHIFSWEQGRLKPLAETTVSMSSQNFALSSIDLDRDGSLELIVSSFMPDSKESQGGNKPSSYIFTYSGGRLREFCDRSRYFMSVATMPPNFTPILVGQDWDSAKVFAPGVREMVRDGNKYRLGARLNLPREATVFNFSWLPGGKGGEGDKLVILAGDERLKVFGPKGDEIFKSNEKYSGSSVGIENVKTMPGLGRDNVQIADKIFLPLRMIPADLNKSGEYTLLANKPISTAAQFFDRYRFFPEGEIHALFWDGVGLGLQWKTRRIKGSVLNLELGDVMNNGIQCLVVGINTHPGAIGVSSRKSYFLVYPLDLSRMDPNTPWDTSDFESTN